MINLINLLNTAIISASMGANLGIKPIYKANNNTNNTINYNYSFNYNSQASQHINRTENVDWEYEGNTYSATKTYMDQTVKYSYTSITTPYTAYNTTYIKTMRDYNNNTTQYSGFKNQLTNVEYYNDAFYYLQITPNNVNINNTLKVNITLSLTQLWQDQYDQARIGTSYFIGNCYTTTDNLSRFYNMSTWTDNFRVYEDIIKSPQNGYRYNVEPIQQTINTTIPSELTYNFELSINLDPTNTNYVCVFITPYIEYDNTPEVHDQQDADQAPGSTRWTWIKTLDSGRWTNPYYTTNPLSISGEYAVAPTNYEVIDIPGMMFQILTMPFTFISMAFNLTLFPGTPYQVNISSLLLTIIGLAILIMILTIIIKAKTGV